MAIVKSNELVAAGRAVQSEVIKGMDTQPHMLIVRYFDPSNADRYKPTASYSAQIRNHGSAIGALTSETVVLPDTGHTIEEVVARASEDKRYTGIMTLLPIPDVRGMLDNLDPAKDIDDLHGLRKRAPTARAMATMGGICLHSDDPVAGGADYFTGKSLDEISKLRLPDNWDSDNICLGGKGFLTGDPLLKQLAQQGIFIRDDQIATYHNQQPLVDLPHPALVFSATPTAEQIRNKNIPDGSIIVDAGFGVIDGVTYGNTEQSATRREEVLVTPPVEGVGPGSTLFLWHHLFEAAGVPPEQMPALGSVVIGQAVMVG